MWLVKPLQGLSTPKIFQILDLKTCSQQDPRKLLQDFQEGKETLCNDLEKPAYQLQPSLKVLKNKLDKLFEQVFMTGSGTGLICIGKKPTSIEASAVQYCNRAEGCWYSYL